jgi:ATP-dependent RNA helicase RhlB
MNDPAEVEIEPEKMTVEQVDQSIYHVSSDEKLNLLLGILKQEEPRNAVVFTNTKRAAEEVSKRLEINGYPCTYIIGDLPQNKRLRVIEDMKQDKVPFLVATDVAARGLHIENLDLVVNYDIPEDPENYVHRIGRTARAGKTGKAVSLACERYVFGLESIESLIGQKIPVARIEEELMEEDDSEGMRIRTGRAGGTSGGRRSDSGRRSDRGRSSRSSRSGGGGRSGGSGRSGGGGRPEAEHIDTAGGAGTSGKAGRSSGGGGKGRTEGGSAGRPSGRGQKSSAGRAAKAGADTPSQAKPSSDSSVDSRLEYYRKKYGEDFELVESGGDSGKKRSAQTEKKASAPGAVQASDSGRPTGPSTTESESRDEREKKKPSLMDRLKGLFKA